MKPNARKRCFNGFFFFFFELFGNTMFTGRILNSFFLPPIFRVRMCLHVSVCVDHRIAQRIAS